jgi:hypothetical protein
MKTQTRNTMLERLTIKFLLYIVQAWKKHVSGHKWAKSGEINSTHFLPEAASNLLTKVTDIKIC